MDKSTLKHFLRWLDTASEAELLARQADLEGFKEQTGYREIRRDITLLLRLIDEERLARWEVAMLRQRSTGCAAGVEPTAAQSVLRNRPRAA